MRVRPPDWVRAVPVDIDGLENAEFWADYWEQGLAGTAMYFGPHLDALPERMAAELRAMTDARAGGILFHCAAGRDRTGMVAMVLLGAVGVVEEVVVYDYLETVRFGESGASGVERRQAEATVAELCRSKGATPESFFRDSVAGFDVERWMAHAGLDEDVRHSVLTWRDTLPAEG